MISPVLEIVNCVTAVVDKWLSRRVALQYVLNVIVLDEIYGCAQQLSSEPALITFFSAIA